MFKKSNNNDEELKLIVIKTKNKIYISDNINGESYHYSQLKKYVFDGEEAKSTYKKDWFEVNQLPTKIEKINPPKKINMRYELKEGFQESELTPKIIEESYIDEDSEYYEVKGLYDLKYDLTKETYEEVPFVLNVIEEIDEEFEITKEEFTPKYNLLDRIQTHPVLLPTKPCSLTTEETYKIIRKHVKANIDPKYAEITSDYDFCFTVQKKIDLYKPYEYEVDVNAMYKRRKPKYEKRYRRSRNVTIYEAAPKPYNSYPVVQPFTGKNLEDLKKNIREFLDDLMKKINEPLTECSHCKGNGVILDEN